MLQELDATEESPYKFLDYYKLEDQDIFFGRKAETRILLSDVVVARLVVLFAKTGTGKTSIINAAVRPALEERGYATFFIRVKKDPITSARYEITKPEHEERWKKGLVWEGNTFAEQLENVSRQLAMPIVLFFDQFEEFFIYPLDEELVSKEEQLARRREFVSNIATIYHNPKSRVHVVFSMREEWFVEMDIFRDEIPKIFHNDSNLRLRWFNEEQARDAIKLPAKEFGVAIEDEVVDRLLADISVNNEVEPAQLQIICDTLWQKTEGERITLGDYLRLGDPRSTEKITRQVLFRRLEEEFEKIQDERQLQLLYALLPKLRTPKETKYVRDVPGLIKELTNDDPSLREIIRDDAERQDLIENLKSNGEPLNELINKLEGEIGLIRTSVRDNLKVIELSHDYLVKSLGDLQTRVKAIGPQRLLEKAMIGYEDSGAPITREVFEKISEAAVSLTLDAKQAVALFASALAYGINMKLWFERTPPEDAWNILEAKIGDVDEAEYVIDLLVELETDRAFKLLEQTLPLEEIATYALEVLGRKETSAAVIFLEKALKYSALAAQAQKALTRIERSKKHPAVAAQARDVLERFSREQEHDSKKVRGEQQDESTLDPTRYKSTYEPRQSYRSDLTDSTLEPHFRAVVKVIAGGRVVPFLGAGVNFLNRSSEKSWEPDQQFLPSSHEFARYLAEKFSYPANWQSGSYEIARISQYISVAYGGGLLYDELRRVFAVNSEPTMLHRFFANLPKKFEKEQGDSWGQLILTTNYDDVMERAFLEASTPFDVISYVADGEGKGKFLHSPFQEEPRLIITPNEYRLPEGRSVILKISGSIDRSDNERDSFVITEDDYIDQLTLADISNSIPVAMRARLQRSHFLFLGYSLRDWNVRVILRRIWGEQRRVYKSWAILLNPDPIEQELWAKRGVDILDINLEDYITALNKHIPSISEV